MNARRVFTAIVWLLAAANLYHLRVADPDLWWYLRCGEDILNTGQIQQTDSYSFTAAGLSYINHEWLTQVILAWLFRWGGPEALTWMKLVLGLVFLVVFQRLLRVATNDPRIHLPALLLGSHVVGRFLLFRPQSFTFLFFTLVLWLLARERRRRTRSVWCLAPLLCLWANMHAAFVIGLALIGYEWIARPFLENGAKGRPTARMTVLLGVCVTATLCNPCFAMLWSYVIQELLNPLNKLYVQEWQPTKFMPLEWNSAVFAGLLLVTIAAALAARARDAANLVLVAIFAAIGFSAPRHIPLFALVALPCLCVWIEKALATESIRPRANLLCAGWAGVAALPAALVAWHTMIDPRPRVAILDQHYKGFPYEAVEFLRAQAVAGNVWNELAWGGYLMWELGPRWKVSLDGRNITLYPREVVQDHFELFAGKRPAESTLAKYEVDLCMVRPERPLVKELEQSDGWEAVYRDRVCVMYRNRGSGLTNLVSPTAPQPPVRPEPLWWKRPQGAP